MKSSTEENNSSENKTSLWHQPFLKSLLQGMGQSIGIGLLFLIPIVTFFYLPKPNGNLVTEVTAVGLGATAAALLAAVIEAPLLVAIGVGVVIWWIATTLL